MGDKVGVLVSRGYGVGWSSWGNPKSCLDKELVSAFERKAAEEEICAIASKNWPEQYQGGLMDCEVESVEVGTFIRINEYDGSESLEIMCRSNYILAE